MSRLARAAALLVLSLAPALFGAAAEPAIDEERLEQIDRLLAEHLETTPLPGLSAVLVAGGEIVFARGYGVTELGGDEPLTARSPLAIGSLAKSLTAVAVLRLAEEGAIDLDAPLVVYLPWLRTADRRGGEITVRMLLHNTSGLPSVDGWLAGGDRSADAARRAARALSSVALVRPPGESFEYSNENWILLGELLAEVGGAPYPELVERRVLAPMGMSESTTRRERFDELGVLAGHATGVDRLRPAPPRFLAAALAAGSEMRASARDVGRYLATLLAGGSYRGERVLSPAGVELLLTPGVTTTTYLPELGLEGEPIGYAMGWAVSRAEGRVVHHHGGDALVMTSWAMLDREAGIGAAVLLNGPTLDPYRYRSPLWLVHNLLRLARGLPRSGFGLAAGDDPTVNGFELPAERLPRYAGSYRSSEGLRAEIALDAESRQLRLETGGPELNLVYELDFASEASVVLRNLSGATRARFLLTPGGQVTGIEGGLFGGRYRKLDDSALDALRPLVAAGGALELQLPRGWTATATTDGLVARADDDPRARLELSFADRPWSERSAALRAELEAAGVEALERDEQLAGRWWRQLIWDSGAGEAGRQTLLGSTEAGERRLELRLDTAAGELTRRVREILLPLLDHLVIEQR